jgi:hypothetical protein
MTRTQAWGIHQASASLRAFAINEYEQGYTFDLTPQLLSCAFAINEVHAPAEIAQAVNCDLSPTLWSQAFGPAEFEAVAPVSCAALYP